jgi:hypothetical protein
MQPERIEAAIKATPKSRPMRFMISSLAHATVRAEGPAQTTPARYQPAGAADPIPHRRQASARAVFAPRQERAPRAPAGGSTWVSAAAYPARLFAPKGVAAGQQVEGLGVMPLRLDAPDPANRYWQTVCGGAHTF